MGVVLVSLRDGPRGPTPLVFVAMSDSVTGSDEWELLAQDIHANGNSVRDAIAKHRAAIQREAVDVFIRDELPALIAHGLYAAQWGDEPPLGSPAFMTDNDVWHGPDYDDWADQAVEWFESPAQLARKIAADMAKRYLGLRGGASFATDRPVQPTGDKTD